MASFADIMSRIFHHPAGRLPEAAGVAASAVSDAARPPAAPASVDVQAVLAAIAAERPEPARWRTSIVDLLKLLDLDASLMARRELADELNVHVGPDGSTHQNVALYRAVMKKLGENGGVVPDNLRY